MFYAVDAEKGTELWSVKAKDKIISSAIIVDGMVLVGSYDRRLRSLDVATGELKWEFKADAQVHCSPAIVAQAEGSSAVIAGCDTKLRVIGLKNGEELLQASAEDRS